jgi:hypothetical protein
MSYFYYPSSWFSIRMPPVWIILLFWYIFSSLTNMRNISSTHDTLIYFWSNISSI